MSGGNFLWRLFHGRNNRITREGRDHYGGPIYSPFINLRREIDRLFNAFDGRFWPRLFGRAFSDEFPFNRSTLNVLAVDIVAKDDAFEITTDLPGMEEKDIEVRTVNGGLLIKGERKAEKEEKKNHYLSERNCGVFERYLSLTTGFDTDKSSASFKNGVLTITLPKTVEGRKSEKKIPIKAA